MKSTAARQRKTSAPRTNAGSGTPHVSRTIDTRHQTKATPLLLYNGPIFYLPRFNKKRRREIEQQCVVLRARRKKGGRFQPRPLRTHPSLPTHRSPLQVLPRGCPQKRPKQRPIAASVGAIKSSSNRAPPTAPAAMTANVHRLGTDDSTTYSLYKNTNRNLQYHRRGWQKYEGYPPGNKAPCSRGRVCQWSNR